MDLEFSFAIKNKFRKWSRRKCWCGCGCESDSGGEINKNLHSIYLPTPIGQGSEIFVKLKEWKSLKIKETM